jgi:hypothetical protein
LNESIRRVDKLLPEAVRAKKWGSMIKNKDFGLLPEAVKAKSKGSKLLPEAVKAKSKGSKFPSKT